MDMRSSHTWQRGAMGLMGYLCLNQKGHPFFVAILNSLAVSTRRLQRLIVEKGTSLLCFWRLGFMPSSTRYTCAVWPWASRSVSLVYKGMLISDHLTECEDQLRNRWGFLQHLERADVDGWKQDLGLLKFISFWLLNMLTSSVSVLSADLLPTD